MAVRCPSHTANEIKGDVLSSGAGETLYDPILPSLPLFHGGTGSLVKDKDGTAETEKRLLVIHYFCICRGGAVLEVR